MENISTPQRAALPWIANLATLAVVVAAIGWSGAQRPDAPTTAAAATVPTATATATAAAPAPAPAADHGAVPRDGAQQGRRPVKTPARPLDGLQVVGYTPNQTP